MAHLAHVVLWRPSWAQLGCFTVSLAAHDMVDAVEDKARPCLHLRAFARRRGTLCTHSTTASVAGRPPADGLTVSNTVSEVLWAARGLCTLPATCACCVCICVCAEASARGASPGGRGGTFSRSARLENSGVCQGRSPWRPGRTTRGPWGYSVCHRDTANASLDYYVRDPFRALVRDLVAIGRGRDIA